MVSLLVLAGAAIMFALGAIAGAPYLRTMHRQRETALDLLKLQAGQTVLDLGSGDGVFLKAAAQRGIRGIGYEINPLLVIWSKLATLRYRKLITIKWANFWNVRWPEVDGIYIFLIGRYMKRFDKKICQQLRKPTPIASYTFKLPGRQIKKLKHGIYLYYWNGC